MESSRLLKNSGQKLPYESKQVWYRGRDSGALLTVLLPGREALYISMALPSLFIYEVSMSLITKVREK